MEDTLPTRLDGTMESLPPLEVVTGRHLAAAAVTGPERLSGSSHALKENDNSEQFILEMKGKKPTSV